MVGVKGERLTVKDKKSSRTADHRYRMVGHPHGLAMCQHPEASDYSGFLKTLRCVVMEAWWIALKTSSMNP